MSKSMKLGSGGRFAKLKGKLESQGKSSDSAAAVAASIGAKKYGQSKMSKMAAKGRKK